MAAPEVAALAKEMASQLIVLKVDTEQEQSLAARYRIEGVPDFRCFERASPSATSRADAPCANAQLD